MLEVAIVSERNDKGPCDKEIHNVSIQPFLATDAVDILICELHEKAALGGAEDAEAERQLLRKHMVGIGKHSCFCLTAAC